MNPVTAISPQAQAVLQSSKNKAEVHEAAQKFEGMFMNEMLSHMFAGVETDKTFGGGKGEEVFKSLMVEQYGTIVAKSGQTGLSKQLEKQMLKMQEEQLNPRLKAPNNFHSASLKV